ncbi:MAG: hypothetical protein KDB27_36525 [Planctomycetales bacterium]|nr:hypothetical protein [Planctomycetales bacterium]
MTYASTNDFGGFSIVTVKVIERVDQTEPLHAPEDHLFRVRFGSRTFLRRRHELRFMERDEFPDQDLRPA